MVVELTMIRHCDLPGFNCIIYLRYLIVPGLLAVGSGPFFWAGREPKLHAAGASNLALQHAHHHHQNSHTQPTFLVVPSSRR